MKAILALVICAGFVAPVNAQSMASNDRMIWTPENQRAALSRLKGKTRDQVIGMIGHPNARYVLDNGAEHWYYSTRIGNAVVYFDKGLAKEWRCGQANMVWWQLGNQAVRQIGLGNFSVIQETPAGSGSDY
jgi:hypothetical protein